jgi:hypothetical protein
VTGTKRYIITSGSSEGDWYLVSIVRARLGLGSAGGAYTKDRRLAKKYTTLADAKAASREIPNGRIFLVDGSKEKEVA